MSQLIGPEFSPKSGNKPKQLVILLHGLGSNGDDLFGLVDYFADILPDAHFLSPNAPFRHPMLASGYQWFALDSWDQDYLYRGMQMAAPILNDYIHENIKKHSLEYKDVLLVGFSQGTMMSLYLAPRMHDAIAGIVGYSGAIIKPSTLQEEVKSRMPILLVHGDSDQVVEPLELEKATNLLQDLGFEVTKILQKNVVHTITAEGIAAAQKFMLSLFF